MQKYPYSFNFTILLWTSALNFFYSVLE